MAQATLGEFEQMVLLALVRLGPEAYGVPITGDIAARTGRDVSLGAVYKTLERLEDKGFVTSRVGDPTPERGGRRKKYYRMQALGAGALRNSMAALRNMTDGLESDFRF